MIILNTILLIYFQKILGAVQAVAPKGDIVTVCNSTYCDDLKPIQWCGNPSEFHLYITSENGDRFRHSVIKSQNTNANPDAVFKITINPCKEYRKIIGFGGALTDASALMISCLSENAKKKLLNSYFHCEKGIGYYLIRTPLGGSDYSVKKYTYCDSDKPDPKLTKFALTEMDLKYKIPLILQAKAISCRTISIKGATWNAPSFMTTEEPANYTAIFNEALPPEIASYIFSLFPPEMINVTRNRYKIKKAFETAWAEYLAMALTAYKNQGVPIKYVTPGNEVHLGASNYWTREDYQRWVTNILCPTLKKHGHDSTQLLALDDMTLFLGKWQKIFENPATRSCFKGVATHWYLDYFPEVVKKTQDQFCEKYPEQIMLPTESSTCEHDPTFHMTSDWEKAVKYAKDILLKLASCAQGYIDWNMVLDFIGGPNYIQNYCYAPVAVNCTADEFHKRILFYVLGHFSKFLPEGSVRVDVTIKANELADSKLQPLQVVAFKVKSLKCSRPNIVIIVLNTNSDIAAIDICFDKGKCTNVKVPKNSIISAVTPLPWNYACF